MDNHRYTVTVSYNPENLEIHQKVVTGILRLYPGAATHFENKNATGRIVLKRDADGATARHLKKIFHGSGARCDIRKNPSLSSPSDRRNSGAADQLEISSGKTASRLMSCPNCGHRQIQDIECHACGIIISKARVRRKSVQRPAAPHEKQPAHPPDPPVKKNAMRAKLRPIPILLQKIHRWIGTEKWTGWAEKAVDRLIRCGLVFIVALVIEVGLAIFLKMSWFLILETTAGQLFIESNADRAEEIQIIADIDPILLGWNMTLTVLCLGLALGCVAQLLHLVRHLFVSQSLIGRLFLWFAPFIGFAAWYVGQREPYPSMVLAVTMVTVPALCLLSSCLYLSRAIFPEIGEFRKIFILLWENRGRRWGDKIRMIRRWFDTAKQAD